MLPAASMYNQIGGVAGSDPIMQAAAAALATSTNGTSGDVVGEVFR